MSTALPLGIVKVTPVPLLVALAESVIVVLVGMADIVVFAGIPVPALVLNGKDIRVLIILQEFLCDILSQIANLFGGEL
jgi:hypothetical protein